MKISSNFTSQIYLNVTIIFLDRFKRIVLQLYNVQRENRILNTVLYTSVYGINFTIYGSEEPLCGDNRYHIR